MVNPFWVSVRNNISKGWNTTENDVSKNQSSADSAIRLPNTSILNSNSGDITEYFLKLLTSHYSTDPVKWLVTLTTTDYVESGFESWRRNLCCKCIVLLWYGTALNTHQAAVISGGWSKGDGRPLTIPSVLEMWVELSPKSPVVLKATAKGMCTFSSFPQGILWNSI
ncbi:hypothetical protein TNCV_20511 [Trichonephila clavipes]|uniref:Uncharacterized protein n=1 Tax=Trichonephila clavipes TaxID=2585209 RepID=A0A8X6R7X0_TRICX|nr:hypothetical protein TNCV_20511 [Trichonephila clavipes]